MIPLLTALRCMLMAGVPALLMLSLAAPLSGQSPADRSAELELGELTRAALQEPASVQVWSGIARTLRQLRPAVDTTTPTPAEAAARIALEAIADRTTGAMREVRVTPAGPHTEIAIRVTGESGYRLFRRLQDPQNPRLTMVLTGASRAVVEESFAGIERGGVRSLQLREFGTDTVQVAVHLQAASAFTTYRRDEDLILRIENPDGEFEPWTSRVPLTGAADIARGILSGQTESGGAAITRSEPVVEPATAPEAISATDLAVPPTIPTNKVAQPSGSATTRVELPVRSATTWTNSLLVPILALIILLGAIWYLRPQRPARLATSRRQEASRIWAARTLAAHGASPDEIVRKTGLARDAVRLLTPLDREQTDAAESAGSGKIFPTPGEPRADASHSATTARR